MALEWPRALPPLPIDADAAIDANFVVTDVDGGPRKKRRRYTAVSKFITVKNWHLRGDDFATLLDFYETQTRGGVDSFTMPASLSGFASSSARFDGVLRWVVISPSEHVQRRLLRVDLDLELLP